MMKCAAGRLQVKGPGFIQDREHFLRLIDAGIERMATDRSRPVVRGTADSSTAAVRGY